MPITRVEGRRRRTDAEVQAIIEAVYRAQREALRVPEWDRQIRYIEHRPENFHVVPGRSENYLLIEISLFAGRSMDAKRALYKAIVRALGPCGVEPDDITIMLHEVPAENWGIRGGHPASEVDLGFEIKV